MYYLNKNICLVLNSRKNNFKFKKTHIFKNSKLLYSLRKFTDEKDRSDFYTDRRSIILRLESLTGSLPNIKKVNVTIKDKKKYESGAYIYFCSFLKHKIINNFLDKILILNFYFYLLFFLNHNHNYKYFEEILRNYFNKKIIFNNGSIIFSLRFYFRWMDLKRCFINTKGKLKKFKVRQRFLNSSRRLKSYEIFVNLKTSFKLYFLFLISNFVRNYYKFILFVYIYFRNKKLKY